MLRLFPNVIVSGLRSPLSTGRVGFRRLPCSFLHESPTTKVSGAIHLEDSENGGERGLPLAKLPGPYRHIPYVGTFFVHLKNSGKASMLNKHLEWSQNYGSIYKETILGKTIIYINDAESVEKVCRSEDNVPERLNSSPIFASVRDMKNHTGISPGLTDSDGEEWQRIRRIYSKRLLRPVEMKNYFTLFNQAAVDAVGMIKRNLNENNVLENQKQFLVKWSMDSFSTFVFGEPFGFMADKPSEDALTVERCMANMAEDQLAYVTLPSIIKPFFKKKHQHILQRNIDFNAVNKKHLMRLIDRREKHGFDEKDVSSFSDYILAQDNLSLNECTAFTNDVFGAAYDTTTTIMDAVLYLIGKHPNVQERLYQEICESIPKNGTFDYKTSQRMPYMRAIVKEAARLYPIAGFLPRHLKDDIILNGYLIPKETTMLLNLYGISRNEKYFDAPLEFRPERWLRGADTPPNPYSSLPFGTGARSCVGRRAAEGNMYAFLTQFFNAFRINDVYGDFHAVMNVFVKNISPVHLKLSER